MVYHEYGCILFAGCVGLIEQFRNNGRCCRMQEEQEAQKKHEEKTKREAIYQQYLERKSERENAEEDSRAGISTVQVTNISVLLTLQYKGEIKWIDEQFAAINPNSCALFN